MLIFSLPVLIVFPFVSLLIGLVLCIFFYWMWRRLKGDTNDSQNIAMQGMPCVITNMFCNFLAGIFGISALLCFIEHSLNMREIEVQIPVTTVSSCWNKYIKASLTNAWQKAWAYRKMSRDIFFLQGYNKFTSLWPWMPSIDLGIHPFIGIGNVSIWVKHSSMVRRKNTNNEIMPIDIYSIDLSSATMYLYTEPDVEENDEFCLK